MPDAGSSPPLPVPRAALAALSGVLLLLAFPPYGDRYHLDHLIWVALVPFFLATRGAGWRRGVLLGWMMGMTLEAAAFIWVLYAIRSFTGLGPVFSSFLFLALLFYSALPWALLGAAVGRCRRDGALCCVLPLWVGVEHFFPRLWPWHLGGAVYGRSWLLQCVDLLGASGLTALVFLTSTAVFRLLQYARGLDRFPQKTVAATTVLVCAALIYGALRLEQIERIESERPRLRVGFVQGSLSPQERHGDRRGTLEGYLEGTRSFPPGPVDLVVWPEGVDGYPFVLEPRSELWSLHVRSEDGGPDLVRGFENLPVPLVGGGGAVEFEGRKLRKHFNVSFYLHPGKDPLFYKKNYRVPFGEVIPLVELLPSGLREKLGFVGTISAGSDNPPFDLSDYRFRNLACYEAVIPHYVRRSGEGSDFLVNITEDYWYGRTGHIPQHVSVLVLRAVESRVPVVRVTNVGPSGIVDVTGEFRRNGRIFEPDRFVLDFAPGRVESFYTRWGHWFPLVALVLGCALAVWTLRGGDVANKAPMNG